MGGMGRRLIISTFRVSRNAPDGASICSSVHILMMAANKGDYMRVYRVASYEGITEGPLPRGGAFVCQPWEYSVELMSLPIPKQFTESFLFGFTKDQMLSVISPKLVKKLQKCGFFVYEVEAKDVEVHEDQVTFNLETAEILSVNGIAVEEWNKILESY